MNCNLCLLLVEIGAHRRRVQIIEPESVRNCSTKNTDKHGHIKPSFASGSPSGDGISCNRLAGDYTYTVPVGNGNYLNIQGNDPELTKVNIDSIIRPRCSIYISSLCLMICLMFFFIYTGC